MSHPTHNFTAKILNYTYCWKCGLILLRNESTHKAMNKPCRNHQKGDK